MEKINIRFRPMKPDDMEVLFVWLNDFGDLSLFDRAMPVPLNVDELKESWKTTFEFSEPPKSLWYVAENEDGEAMGMCGLQKIDMLHGDALMAVIVDSKQRGMGLATAAAFAIAEIAFNSLRLHRLSTLYREDNAITKRLVEKMGCTVEGTIREGWFAKGNHYDVIRVGLLKSEWQAKSSQMRDKLLKGPLRVLEPDIGLS